MQSRWFDFGGNTIIRADQYASKLHRGLENWADLLDPDTYDLPQTNPRRKDGFSRVSL